MGSEILLIRDAETNWKFRGRMQGISPIPLNDHGVSQSKMLADYLTREYGGVEEIYTSDLRRAKQTAEIIQDAFNGSPEIFEDKMLREQNWGAMQGLTVDQLFSIYPSFNYNEVGDKVLELRPDNGESMYQVQERVTGWWNDFITMVSESSPDHPYVVLTHNMPLNVILSELTEKTYFDMVQEYDHDPIEVGLVKVDENGEVVDVTEPEPPWGTN